MKKFFRLDFTTLSFTKNLNLMTLCIYSKSVNSLKGKIDVK